MKFHPGEHQWPKCAKVLKAIASRVKQKSQLRKALMSRSGLDAADLQKYLKWGSSLPLVYFDFPAKPSNGWYKPGTNIINVNVEIAFALEFKGHSLLDGLSRYHKASTRELDIMLESTVLHEFVHWARRMVSAESVHVAKEDDKHEAGKSFECAAYGGDISLFPDDGLYLSRGAITGGDRYDTFTCKSKVDSRIKLILKDKKKKK